MKRQRLYFEYMDKESVISELEKRIYEGVDEVLDGYFFHTLSKNPASKQGWAEFFVQKYNGTSFLYRSFRMLRK